MQDQAYTGYPKPLSRDVAKHNITINNVLPERIDTDRQTQIIEMQSKLMKVSFEEAKDSIRWTNGHSRRISGFYFTFLFLFSMDMKLNCENVQSVHYEKGKKTIDQTRMVLIYEIDFKKNEILKYLTKI